MPKVAYTIEDVEHMVDLILPKLRAVGEGDGSYIHRANHLIATIKGWLTLAKMYEDVPHLVTCREYIRTAEIWLAEIAKKGCGE